MGCGTGQLERQTVPIGNSLIHLLQTGQNETLKKKILAQAPLIYDLHLNFKGDTIVHYACYKNNYELVEFLKNNGAKFTVQNYEGRTPPQLTTNQNILKLIGVQPNKSKHILSKKILQIEQSNCKIQNQQQQIIQKKQIGTVKKCQSNEATLTSSLKQKQQRCESNFIEVNENIEKNKIKNFERQRSPLTQILRHTKQQMKLVS